MAAIRGIFAAMSELAPSPDDALPADDVRARIVAAAAGLIAAGGSDAATTRAVAAAAHVQAPTIYRLFGDKRGLLDAVVDHEMAAYIAEKRGRTSHPDPVQDLRDGWDTHIAFGLAHPGLFAIMSGGATPRPPSTAVAAGLDALQRRVRAIALAGRLRVSEARAVAMLHAAGTGVVLTLLAQPEAARDPGLSEAAREAMLAAITGEAAAAAPPGPGGAATALRASLGATAALTRGERHLLEELLDRIADGDPRTPDSAA